MIWSIENVHPQNEMGEFRESENQENVFFKMAY